MKHINSREKDLETIVVLAAASLVFFYLFRKNVFILAAFTLLFVGLFFKSAAAKISAVWLRFSEILGAFNARIILGIVYFLVLTPISVLYRMFVKKHANSPRTDFERSYFNVREHSFEPSDLEKMW